MEGQVFMMWQKEVKKNKHANKHVEIIFEKIMLF